MTRRLVLTIDGTVYEEWTSGGVSRDMKDFSGTFSFQVRDGTRSAAALPFASPLQLTRVRPGQAVTVTADGQPVLVGFVGQVHPQIDAQEARVDITGKDKAGDLIDCAAAAEGPGEFKNMKLDEVAKRLCEPFGLPVRCEIDAGQPFARYAIDVGETALSAIEKGARQRHALVTSDGVGGMVITRTGATRAPADLRLPGNVISADASFSHKNRFSKTIVRGQGEKGGGHRATTSAKMLASGAPTAPGDRTPGDGSATELERKGTAITGVAVDEEITRYRPIVHRQTASTSDGSSATDEADWRMRTRRGEGEEIAYTVAGFSANGQLWRTNQMAFVDDAFLGIARDMLISRVTFRSDEDGDVTELTVTSPEAFDKAAVGKQRANVSKGVESPSKGGRSGFDGTAEAL